jgi:hypothetical protein
LTGAFASVTLALDEPGNLNDRTWIDLNTSRERAEELLKHRTYQADELS